LADAGIPMRDLISACAAGKVEGQVVLDLTDVEDKGGDSDMPLAYQPSADAITLLQTDGMSTLEEFEQMVKLAIEGCKKLNQVQKEALRVKYEGAKEGESEKEEEEGEE